MTPQNSNQPKNWPARHWKLIVGLSVATFAVMVSAALVGFFAFITTLLKKSDVAVEAMARARVNSAVVQRLGSPIKLGWIVSGSINLYGSSGDANLVLPLSGPKGKGAIYVTAHKSAGVWSYSVMQVVIGEDKQTIDLRANPSPAPATTSLPGSLPCRAALTST